jgi:hypothetical protein
MPLHRDIFWVGRQWAVTGYGMQAVDQKQKSKFDIEVARLWEDDLLDGLSAERWFNLEDFSKGLSIARARYPELPLQAALRLKEKAAVAPSKPAPKVEPVKPEARPEAKPNAPSRAAEPSPVNPGQISQPSPRQVKLAPSLRPVPEAEAPKPVVAKFVMRLEGGGAKFVPMWRIRIRR